MKQRIIVLLSVLLLTITGISATAQDDENTPPFDTLINVMNNSAVSYLVNSEGMTLYQFTLDDTLCTDACLDTWQPLTVENTDTLTAADGIPGTLGTFERDNGILQVTYNNIPLYTFANDLEVGDLNGDLINDAWFIVEPKNLYIRDDETLGHFLVSGTGMTLYVSIDDFPNDSRCTDECLQTWMPYTVDSDAELTTSRAVFGRISLFERADSGDFHVTYNDRPLYLYSGDNVIGDTNGQGIDETWFVFPPETVDAIGIETTGTYLIGPYRLPLYAFQGDEPGQSNCVDDCTETWIPLTVNPNDRVYAGALVDGEIDLSIRPDDSLQVTFNQMPLYYYSGDTELTSLAGNGIDDDWFAVEAGIPREFFMQLTTVQDFGGDEDGDDDESDEG